MVVAALNYWLGIKKKSFLVCCLKGVKIKQKKQSLKNLTTPTDWLLGYQNLVRRLWLQQQFIENAKKCGFILLKRRWVGLVTVQHLWQLYLVQGGCPTNVAEQLCQLRSIRINECAVFDVLHQFSPPLSCSANSQDLLIAFKLSFMRRDKF